MFACLSSSSVVRADTTWNVALTIQEIEKTSGWDAAGQMDYYWEVEFRSVAGSNVTLRSFSSFDTHADDRDRVFPRWSCATQVRGEATPLPTDPPGVYGPEVLIFVRLREYDTTSADDDNDIHPAAGSRDLYIYYRPAVHLLRVPGAIDSYQCAGWTSLTGDGSDADGDAARIVFSVSDSPIGAPQGDTDGDGLPDSLEICGSPQINLPAIGADPYRKDVFVEIDWMAEPGTASPHSHEPWLPALINIWNEFNVMPVTNPTVNGRTSLPGIALHIDTGLLYANYQLDFNADGTPEIQVGPDGNIDLNHDGIPEIGNLGPRAGVGIGGERLAEDPVLGPRLCEPDSDLGAIKAAHFSQSRRGIFRYCVFGHDFDMPCRSGFACNDEFIVTLGCAGFENSYLAPGPGGTPTLVDLRGPSGLMVRGSINQHAGTFIHELGHTLWLGHGGNDGINHKPNYLSIMNYAWQFDGISFDANGDNLADALGFDYNRDGRIDNSRFMYSSVALPALNESNLNESAGIGAAGTAMADAITKYGPELDLNGDHVLDIRLATALGTLPINWNRNSDTADTGVSSMSVVLSGSGSTVSTPTDINRWQSDNPSPGQVLNGFNDCQGLQSRGLPVPRVPGASIPADDELTEDLWKQMQRNTTRVVELPDEASIAKLCQQDLETITFEDIKPGTPVNTQYEPLATFVEDASANQIVEGPNERGGVPTQSPDNSLVVIGSAPLRVTFGQPQRLVGLYVGRITPGNPESDTAILTAYDTEGYIMGQVQRKLPDVSQGITGFLGFGAIYADQPIKKIEVSFGGTAMKEPVRVDQLMMCYAKAEPEFPTFPPPPAFGESVYTVQVQAVESQAKGPPVAGDPGHNSMSSAPLTGVTIKVDGEPQNTAFSFNRHEGTQASLLAPETFNGLRFLHWRSDDGVSFGLGQTDISLPILREATLMAVYMADTDGDGRLDASDNCPLNANPDQADDDNDGVGNECDRCPGSDDHADADGDGVPDGCDTAIEPHDGTGPRPVPCGMGVAPMLPLAMAGLMVIGVLSRRKSQRISQ